MGCSASIVSSKGSSHPYRKTSARTNRKRHRKLVLEKQRKQTDQPLPFTTGKDFVKNGTVKSGTHESKEKSKDLFMQEALQAHNQLRALHGVPDFKLCKSLTEHAQVWADNIAHTNMTIHSSCKLPSGETIGENIYTCWSSFGNNQARAGDAVRSWYGESALYDYDKASFSYKTGHFTQVIWKESISMGMAWSKSNDGTIYVVANYLPAGNVHGLFGENVLRPIHGENNNNVEQNELISDADTRSEISVAS